VLVIDYIDEPHEPRLLNGTIAYDLTTLPLCGALTRSGKSCRRYGNLKTGRCRLHGGLSTGPKTKNGLEKSRKANFKHGYYSLESKAKILEVKQLLKESKKLLKSLLVE